MFQDAIRTTRNYTYPILISFRKKNGETGSAIGSFIILNKDGYILTAYHVVKKIEEIRKEVREYNEYMQVKNACTSLVFTRHTGSPSCDQAACFVVCFSGIGTTGGSFFFPRASRSAWAGVRPLRR